MILALIASCLLSSNDRPAFTQPFDWGRMPPSWHNLRACDLNGDGLADLWALDDRGRPWISLNWRGWKAGAWRRVLRDEPLFERIAELPANSSTREAAKGGESCRTSGEELSGPPLEPRLQPAQRLTADMNGDGQTDDLAVYRCTRPFPHQIIRIATVVAPAAKVLAASTGEAPEGTDMDGDGLGDLEEWALGTDPCSRDSDQDGLLDGWEAAADGNPELTSLLPLDPNKPDLILLFATAEGVTQSAVETAIDAAKAALAPHIALHALRCGGESMAANPDASTRREGGEDAAQRLPLTWIPPEARGVARGMLITRPYQEGRARQTGDEGISPVESTVVLHELGHMMGLTHGPAAGVEGSPLYPSVMNPAYLRSTAIAGFSEGGFRGMRWHESALEEIIHGSADRWRPLNSPPFRFHVEERGENTWVDWNRNGRPDAGVVAADVNDLPAAVVKPWTPRPDMESVPALAFYGEAALAAWPSSSGDRLRCLIVPDQGAERSLMWDAHGHVEGEPVWIQDADPPLLAWRANGAWQLARFSARMDGPPSVVPLEGVEGTALAGLWIEDRALLVEWRPDRSCQPLWLRWNAPGGLKTTKSTASSALQPRIERLAELPLRSVTPVALARNPVDRKVALIWSAPTLAEGFGWLSAGLWTCGEGGPPRLEAFARLGEDGEGVAASLRPAAAFDAQGTLFIFHAGAPAADGDRCLYRTRGYIRADGRQRFFTTLMIGPGFLVREAPALALEASRAWLALRNVNPAYPGGIGPVLVNEGALGEIDGVITDQDDWEILLQWGLAHSILYAE